MDSTSGTTLCSRMSMCRTGSRKKSFFEAISTAFPLDSRSVQSIRSVPVDRFPFYTSRAGNVKFQTDGLH